MTFNGEIEREKKYGRFYYYSCLVIGKILMRNLENINLLLFRTPGVKGRYRL